MNTSNSLVIGSTWTWSDSLACTPEHGIEISAVCDHCQKREKLTAQTLPAEWIRLTTAGKVAALCSFACVEKYGKAQSKK